MSSIWVNYFRRPLWDILSDYEVVIRGFTINAEYSIVMYGIVEKLVILLLREPLTHPTCLFTKKLVRGLAVRFK